MLPEVLNVNMKPNDNNVTRCWWIPNKKLWICLAWVRMSMYFLYYSIMLMNKLKYSTIQLNKKFIVSFTIFFY